MRAYTYKFHDIIRSFILNLIISKISDTMHHDSDFQADRSARQPIYIVKAAVVAYEKIAQIVGRDVWLTLCSA